MLGEEHPDTLTAMGNLAVSLRALGEKQAARALLEKVVEGSQRVLGAEHPDTLMAMDNLAVSLQALGEEQAARALLEKVTQVKQRSGGGGQH